MRAADDAGGPGAPGGRDGQALARPVAVPRPGARRRRRRHGAGPRAWTRATRAAVAEEVGAVMHCAASISFDLPLDEARADQRRGHARDHRASPARPRPPARLERFIHVSTAYVAGHHQGHVPREPARRGPGVPQHLRADQVGGRARRQRRVRPRPGDRPPVDRDGRVGLRLDARLQRPLLADPRVLARAVRRGPGAARRRSVDVVPVDYVADALVHLLEDTSSSGVVNLVSGREACTVDDLVGDDLRRVRQGAPAGRRRPARPAPAPPTPTTRPRCTSRTSTWTWSSTTRAPARCSARPGIRCPHLTDYFPRLIEYAQTTRWGKTPLTREEAAAAHAPA